MTLSKMAALVVVMLICILAVYVLVGQKAAAGRSTEGSEGGQVRGLLYEDRRLGFALEYPSDWTATDQPQLGADATFLGPRRGDFTMSLDVRSEVSPVELNAYVNRSIKTMLPSFKSDFELVEEEPQTINGVDAVKVRYTYSQGDYKVTAVSVIYGIGDRKVALTFNLLTEYYDDLKAAVDGAIASFRKL